MDNRLHGKRKLLTKQDGDEVRGGKREPDMNGDKRKAIKIIKRIKLSKQSFPNHD